MLGERWIRKSIFTAGPTKMKRFSNQILIRMKQTHWIRRVVVEERGCGAERKGALDSCQYTLDGWESNGEVVRKFDNSEEVAKD